MSYSKPKIYEKHRFYNNDPVQIDDDEYRKKKLKAFRENEKRDKDTRFKKQRDILIWRILKHSKFKATGVSKWLKEGGEPLEFAYLRNISQEHEKLHKNKSIL